MARTDQAEIRMRLVIENPARGVTHSLQDKKSQPVDPQTSKDGKPLTFDFVIRIAPGPKFFGEHVRQRRPRTPLRLHRHWRTGRPERLVLEPPHEDRHPHDCARASGKRRRRAKPSRPVSTAQARTARPPALPCLQQSRGARCDPLGLALPPTAAASTLRLPASPPCRSSASNVAHPSARRSTSHLTCGRASVLKAGRPVTP